MGQAETYQRSWSHIFIFFMFMVYTFKEETLQLRSLGLKSTSDACNNLVFFLKKKVMNTRASYIAE